MDYRLKEGSPLTRKGFLLGRVNVRSVRRMNGVRNEEKKMDRQDTHEPNQ